MASSGTFTGSRPLTYSPIIIMDWQILQQDAANNRSQIRLTLKLYSEYNISFSATKTGVLDGTSFSYSGGMSGTGQTRTIATKDLWVSHNSDGTKSQSFSATFNINIYWGGSWLGTLSVSGTAVLDAIARASSLTSFAVSSDLQVSTTNSITLTIVRQSTSFTHDITLLLGSTTIASWTGQITPTSLSLTTNQVNSIINLMPTTTTATLTLRVQTKSDSTNIGSSVTRTATTTLNANIIPTATNPSLSIFGSGRDNTIGKYVQSISRVTASFTRSAGYGASISSSSIVIRRDSDKGNAQTINSNSGTISTAVSSSGLYEAVATVTDSRGRSTTSRSTFTVHAYTSPRITSFTAVRNATTPTTVNTQRTGTYTPLGTGDNTLNVVVARRLSGGTWSNLSTTNITTASFSTAYNSTSNAITSSYQFRLTITDSFSASAVAIVTVSTSKVVFAIDKNDRVGIGKIPERGVLDVGGEVYLNNNFLFAGSDPLQPTVTGGFVGGSATQRLRFFSNTTAINSPAWMEMWGAEVGTGLEDRAGEFVMGGTQFAWRLQSTTSSSGIETMKLERVGSDTKLHINPSSGNSIIELGNTASSGVSAIDFHSSGNNNDYDCRIRSDGGGTSSAGGKLLFQAGSFEFSSALNLYSSTYRDHLQISRSGITWDVTPSIDDGGSLRFVRNGTTIGYFSGLKGQLHGRDILTYSSGSNTNGSWIRFEDGTQICWNSQNHGSVAINLAWGSGFGRPLTLNNYPVAFNAVPTVIKSMRSSSHTIITAISSTNPTSTNPGGIEPFRMTSMTVSNLTSHYVAIGTWK